MANFFEQQAQARSATKKLVFLYVLAVAIIVSVLTAVAHLAFAVKVKNFDPATLSAADFFVAIAILGVIAIGTFVRLVQVGSNGEYVALQLGGVPVSSQTEDPLERRLMNVIEEMSIASGVSVPRVFILKNEAGINAFAAGTRPSEAVIGVTRGTIEQLTRDELQGVIAHEFSHIFNGDMRLNLRLMGVLGGILALTTIGRLMLDATRGRSSSSSSSKKNDAGAFVLVGIAFVAVGYIGVFFARLIKAAVSRQREFLADASSVQYTRNPEGIGGALMKIRGFNESSQIRSGYAEETSHMFFGSALSLSSMFATHPPLEDRIGRVAPNLLKPGAWKPIPARADIAAMPNPAPSRAETSLASLNETVVTGSKSVAVAAVVDAIGSPRATDLAVTKAFLQTLPDGLREKTRDPLAARALTLSLFLDANDGSREQHELITEALGIETLQSVLTLRSGLNDVAEASRLSLLDLSMTSLRTLPLADRRQLVELAHALTNADGSLDLFEYVAATILDHQLLRGERPRGPKPNFSSSRTTSDISILLSSIAYAGADTVETAKDAFDSGLTKLRTVTGERATFRALDECELSTIAGAIDRLSYMAPYGQAILIEACLQTVLYDRIVTTKEHELMRALCAVLEAPLPALAGA